MDGFGKACIHDLRVGPDEKKLMRSKRCIRVRGTHDLETRQHALSVVGSSYRWSMMRSRISGGREDDIAVSCQVRSASLDRTRTDLIKRPHLSSCDDHLRWTKCFRISTTVCRQKELQGNPCAGRFVQQLKKSTRRMICSQPV